MCVLWAGDNNSHYFLARVGHPSREPPTPLRRGGFSLGIQLKIASTTESRDVARHPGLFTRGSQRQSAVLIELFRVVPRTH